MTLVVLVALAIAVGLVGMVVPLLPGSLLVGAAIGVWALVRAEPGAWVTFAVAAGLLAVGVVVKYLVPGRRLAESGVPGTSLLVGACLGLVGFFVVPVLGLPLGFVAGIYGAEWVRQGHERALPATIAALRAVGTGIAIELAFGLAAALVWVVGVVAV
jgi:uncharacterized protein YqgC (DUF456 family)